MSPVVTISKASRRELEILRHTSVGPTVERLVSELERLERRFGIQLSLSIIVTEKDTILSVSHNYPPNPAVDAELAKLGLRKEGLWWRLRLETPLEEIQRTYRLLNAVKERHHVWGYARPYLGRRYEIDEFTGELEPVKAMHISFTDYAQQ